MQHETTIINYPIPAGLQTCQDFDVAVDGRPVWVEDLRRPCPDYAPDWFREPEVLSMLAVRIAAFGCSGPCVLTITPKRQPIAWPEIMPAHLRIPIDQYEDGYRLHLPGPCKLRVQLGEESNGDHASAPLLIFADAPETERPPDADAFTRVFGAGVHEPGLMTLQDNERLYLAPGAIVYGGFRGSPHNVKVYGRGILDGSHIDDHHMIRLANAVNVEFAGITIRCGKLNWLNRLDNCEQVVYRNVKLLSFINQGDGIDPCNCRNVLIEDCFLRCADDCIAVKAFSYNGYPDCVYPAKPIPNVSHITVARCIMEGYAFGDGFTIGIECDAERIENILVRDCAILRARGGNTFGGHAAFSMNCDGPAVIRNVRFENIEVAKAVNKNCHFAINNAGYTNEIRQGCRHTATPLQPASPGHVNGVTLKNIHWEGNCPMIVAGYDMEHRVEDVAFEDCTVNGKPLTREQLQLNSFVSKLTVMSR